MRIVLSVLRRTLLVPATLPVAFVSVAAAWIGTELASVGLGGSEGFVAEVRQGTLLFAGVLTLSLAEPLEIGREARGGLLLLRAARGGGFALGARWIGLVLATLPVLALVMIVTGGWPPRPGLLLLELLVASAAGLALGAWLDRARLVPALWVLMVAGYVRPWLLDLDISAPLAFVLPALGGVIGFAGWAHGLLWALGVLVLADWRLRCVVARGG